MSVPSKLDAEALTQVSVPPKPVSEALTQVSVPPKPDTEALIQVSVPPKPGTEAITQTTEGGCSGWSRVQWLECGLDSPFLALQQPVCDALLWPPGEVAGTSHQQSAQARETPCGKTHLACKINCILNILPAGPGKLCLPGIHSDGRAPG